MLLLVLFVGVNAGCGGYYVGFGVGVGILVVLLTG